MRPVRSAVILPLALLLGTGCLPVIEPCAFNDNADGLLGATNPFEPYTCQDGCFEDLDDDRWGGALLELVDSADADCPAGSVAQGGDCDDEDANAFPGNREVCDGADNDCDGEANFDTELEDEEGTDTWVFSCTPPNVRIQIFLVGGGSVTTPRGVTFIDGTTTDIRVVPGEELSMDVRLRTIVPASEADSPLGAGVARSWGGESNSLAFTVMWDGSQGSENQPPVGRFDLPPIQIDSISAPAVSSGSEFENIHYVTLASGLGPDPSHVGSLTDPFYCYAPGEGEGQPPCAAVWDDVPGLGEGPDPDRDLADLDELDLAACQTFGAARAPTLFTAFDDDGAPCSFDEEPEGPGPVDRCIPLYEARTIGCAYLQLTVEEDGR